MSRIQPLEDGWNLEKLLLMKFPFLFFTFLLLSSPSDAQKNSTSIHIDLLAADGKMNPFWTWFGYDEPNYTYMRDGKKLLDELASLTPAPVHIRVHNLLTTGDGTASLKWGSTNAYTEDSKGNPVYNWIIVDSIIDSYIKRGMKPLMEIGFMPEAMSTHPQPYKHNWNTDGKLWTGWTYPPKDYFKWSELVYQWVRHSIDRYGYNEVKSWFWELWNEPNIGYWSGTFDEYCKLYDYSADAVKHACPECTMGGPHTTNPDSEAAEKFLRDFLTHCDNGINYATGKNGAPLDYISFHAKGNPALIDDHIRMNMSPQLKAIQKGFEVIASIEKFKKLPVVIGECDPEGCAACSVAKQPQNAYRNGTMYSSYTAASFSRIYDLAKKYEINLVGSLTWAFEFEDQRWFDGFRDLATNGIDKPVLNVFRMFGLMPLSERLRVATPNSINAGSIIEHGVHGEQPDIYGMASKDYKSAAVMVWNYHDDDLPAEPAVVELLFKNIPSTNVMVYHYRIDDEHSNSFESWKKMGSPQEIPPEQYKSLEETGKLQLYAKPFSEEIKDQQLQIRFLLPRHGISLIKIEW